MRAAWLGLMLTACGGQEPPRPEVLAPEPVQEPPPPPPEPVTPPFRWDEWGPGDGFYGDPVRLGPNRVRGILSKNTPDLLRCHDEARKANPGIEGQISLRWTTSRGVARNIVTLTNTTGDENFATCVAARVRGWDFAGAEEGTVQDTWTFRLPTAAEEHPRLVVGPVSGPSAAQTVTKSNRNWLFHCQEEALTTHPGLVGDLTLRWTVGGEAVTDVQVVADSLRNDGLTACVLNKVRRWPFRGVPDGPIKATFEFKLSGAEVERDRSSFVFEPKVPAPQEPRRPPG